MSLLHENIKELLADVECFLDTSLQDGELAPAQRAQKAKILDGIKDVWKKYPQLKGRTEVDENQQFVFKGDVAEVEDTIYDCADELEEPTTPMSPTTPIIPTTPHPDTSDIYYSDEIVKDQAATDTAGATKFGLLKKKEKKKFSRDKKKFCMIKDDIFYLFKETSSKKQSDAFSLRDGYEARPSIESPTTKKDFLFDVICPGKRSFCFAASSHEDMEEWIQAVNGSEGLYEDTENITLEKRESEKSRERFNGGVTYEDTGMILPSHTPPPPRVEKTSEDSLSAKQDSPPAAAPARKPLPPPSEEIYDDTEPSKPIAPLASRRPESIQDDDEDLYAVYDDSEIPQPLSGIPEMDRPPTPPISRREKAAMIGENSSKPSTYYTKPPLPPRTFSDGNTDYSRLYYGLWDCEAGDDNDELAFKRGDIIDVINKDHDDKSWWVGKLHNEVGLVPKNYLTRAYELVR